jgi:hypothetical protein
MLPDVKGAIKMKPGDLVGPSRLVDAIRKFHSRDPIANRDNLLSHLKLKVTAEELVADREAQMMLCERLRRATDQERVRCIRERGSSNPLLYIDFPGTDIKNQEQAETFMLSGDDNHLYYFPHGRSAVRTRLERAAIGGQSLEHVSLQTGEWQKWDLADGARNYSYRITDTRLLVVRERI